MRGVIAALAATVLMGAVGAGSVYYDHVLGYNLAGSAITDSAGPLQLGGACAAGVAGDTCHSGKLYGGLNQFYTGGAFNNPYIAHINDTASTPGYSWKSDTNTGMYRIDADTIGFSAGGTEAARITSTNTTLPGDLTLGPDQKIVLDADGDTYIASDLDDIVRIYAAGASRSLFSSTSVIHSQSTFRTSAFLAQFTGIETDLTAGACSAGAIYVDTGGANREWCRCNTAATAYDCCTFAASPTCTTNGPVD